MTAESSPLKAMFDLARLNLSLAVAFSALAGFVMCGGTLGQEAQTTFLAVFLLSAAASALNQYQERNTDALMERARLRPIPSRRLTPAQALSIAALCATPGLVLLWVETTPAAAVLGLVTIVWYNGIYTPLKAKSAYAVLIGAVAGALPPVIGYCAAGGKIGGEVLALAMFMYLWQVPHFLLVVLKYGREYEAAGLPTLWSRLSAAQLRAVAFIALGSASCSALLLPLSGALAVPGLSWLLVAAIALLLWYFREKLVRAPATLDFTAAFRAMYGFQGLVLLVLIVGALIASRP